MDVKHQYGTADIVPLNGFWYRWRVTCHVPNGRHSHSKSFRHEADAIKHAEHYMSLPFRYYKSDE